jgi:hypothetical protein
VAKAARSVIFHSETIKRAVELAQGGHRRERQVRFRSFPFLSNFGECRRKGLKGFVATVCEI